MKVLMVKYIFLIKTYIKMYKSYPVAVFFKLIELPVQMFMYIFLWFYISKSSDIDVNYMIFYYLVTGLLSLAYPFLSIAVDIEKDVLEGGIANCLVRPYHYIMPLLTKYISWMCIYSVVYIPTLILIYFCYKISFAQVLMFIIFSLLGMFIEFMFWFFIGLFSLFFEKVRGLIRIIAAFKIILSGGLIPLSLMPTIMQKISNFVPFKYYIYVPVNSLLTKLDLATFVSTLCIALLWLLSLSFLSFLTWKKGINQMQTNMS